MIRQHSARAAHFSEVPDLMPANIRSLGDPEPSAVPLLVVSVETVMTRSHPEIGRNDVIDSSETAYTARHSTADQKKRVEARRSSALQTNKPRLFGQSAQRQHDMTVRTRDDCVLFNEGSRCLPTQLQSVQR
jgi:hypothetical protein